MPARPPIRLLSLLLLVLVAFWGCASRPPTPPREWVVLKTSSSTQYYSVRGTTASAIFDAIDRNGLFDNEARRAVGLTSAEWSIDWKGSETRPGACSAESMTIALVLVVTLPKHDQLNDLSQSVRTNWQRFAARVAAHEQRHVDIYLNGARKMKSLVEATSTRTSSCSELESKVRGIWESQKAEIERAQNEFHLEDEARLREGQKPLRSRIDVNQTRLGAINSEIRGLDQTLENLKRQRDRTRAEIGAVKAELAKSGASLASCPQSRPTSGTQALCQRYNGLVTAYDALVEQNNGVVSRRNTLAVEHNRLVAVINDFLEDLNWAR